MVWFFREGVSGKRYNSRVNALWLVTFMIQSMTGYATAQHVDNDICYALEIRTLNNRYLKLSIKLPEQLLFLENDIEKLIRRRVARGSVSFTIRFRGDGGVGLLPLNAKVMQHYVNQMSSVVLPGDMKGYVDLTTLANLPGVCAAPTVSDSDREGKSEMICQMADRAMDSLLAMRRLEGEELSKDLSGTCEAILLLLVAIEKRAPLVVQEYHQRLQSRVSDLMQSGRLELETEALAREVAIYADRCDISEEITRLRSHLGQFQELCERDEAVGRTLDFLTQELLREANTIASKSNDSDIARNVVEIKGLIDRLREQVQNVE